MITEETYWEALELWCDKWMDGLLKFIETFQIHDYNDDEFKRSISSSPNVTIDSIKKYPYTVDDWGFSSNENITWKMIQNNNNIEWDYLTLSSNPNITCINIIDTKEKKWNWMEVSRRFPSIHRLCERKIGFRFRKKFEPIEYYEYKEYELIKNPTPDDLFRYLNSSSINWEKIQSSFNEVKRVKCETFETIFKVTYDDLINAIICNPMKVERDKVMRRYFQNKFKQSSLKNEIEQINN